MLLRLDALLQGASLLFEGPAPHDIVSDTILPGHAGQAGAVLRRQRSPCEFLDLGAHDVPFLGWSARQDSNLRIYGVGVALNHLNYEPVVDGVGLEPTISAV